MGSSYSFKAYIIVVSILLLSGCVDLFPPATGTFGFSGYGTGIKVHSFDFSSDKVYSGQPSLLTLEMQNRGAIGIEEDIYVYLYGLSRGENEWFDDLSDIGLSGASMAAGDPRVLIIDSLMAPIKSLDADGESAQITWVLDAPNDLPEGQVFKFSAGTRVCYPYSTTSIAKIEVLDEEEYLSRDRDGTLRKHAIRIDTTAGPLDVVMTTDQPMMLSDDTDELTLRVKIVDRGGGTIITQDCSDVFEWEDNVLDLFALHDKVSVTLDNKECDLELKELYFRVSGSGPPTADFPVTCNIPSLDVPMRILDLKMRFEYNYFIDKSTVISVEGLGEEE
ncbi:MAG: hypothetical protein KAS90_01295 [Candidatus Aenigmarchaeota archaeon]|nr:hypothetical protein [Candidatus Aenigmarchaeota archaeon]